MIMAALGLLAPFLPDLLGMGQSWLDHKYEKEMLTLRFGQEAKKAEWKMQEIELQAQSAEMLSARKPHQSYGVKLLEAADRAESTVWRWSFNVVFIAFSFLDWLISSVRPVVTYWCFGLYALVKMAAVYITYTASAKFSEGIVEALSKTALNEATFTTFDQDMLLLVVGFWFGNRLRHGRSNKP